MKIDQLVEKDGDVIRFQGTLEGPQLAFVVEYGLNKLMQDGALPFIMKKDRPAASVMTVTDTSQ